MKKLKKIHPQRQVVNFLCGQTQKGDALPPRKPTMTVAKTKHWTRHKGENTRTSDVFFETPTGSTIGVLRFIYIPLASARSPWHDSYPQGSDDPPIPPVCCSPVG